MFKAQRTIAQSQENKAEFHKLIEGLTAEHVARVRKSNIPLVQRAFQFFDENGMGDEQLIERLRREFHPDFCLSVNDEKKAPCPASSSSTSFWKKVPYMRKEFTIPYPQKFRKSQNFGKHASMKFTSIAFTTGGKRHMSCPITSKPSAHGLRSLNGMKRMENSDRRAVFIEKQKH